MTPGPPPLSAFSWSTSALRANPSSSPASPPDLTAAPTSPAAPAATATAISTAPPSAPTAAHGSIHVRLPYDFLTSPTSTSGPRPPCVSTSKPSRTPATQASWEPVVEWSPPPQAGRADGGLVRSPRVRMSASKPASSTAAAAAAAAAPQAPPEPLSLRSLPEGPSPSYAQDNSPHPGDCGMALPPPAVMGPGRKASVSLHLFSGSVSNKHAKDKSGKGATPAQVPTSAPSRSSFVHAVTSPTASTSRNTLPYDKDSPRPPSAEPATPLALLGQVNPDLVSITRSITNEKRTGLPSPTGSPPPPHSPALPTSSSGPAPRPSLVSPQGPVPEEAVSTSDTSSYNSSDSDSLYTANGEDDEDEEDTRPQRGDRDAPPSAPCSKSISIPSHPSAARRGLEGSSSPSLGTGSLPLSDQSPSGDEEDEHGGQLPTVIQLQPFYNQVGGHSSIFQFSSHAVCKPLVSRENQFYESLELNGRQLLKFVPRYLGVLNVSFRPVEHEEQTLPAESQSPSSLHPQNSGPSPAPQQTGASTLQSGTSTQPGTPGLPPKRKIFKGQNMDDVEVPEVAVEMNRHLMPEWVLGEGEHEGSHPHSPPPTLWALEHPRIHSRAHGHSPPGSSNGRYLEATSGTSRSYDSGAVSDPDARPSHRSRTPFSSSPHSPPASSSPRRHFSPPRSEGRHSSVPYASGRGPLGLATGPSSTTPSGTPRPVTPGTPSNTQPPGSQACVFGRGSTAVNRRLQAQVLREVFSASNLRDAPAAARRRTRSSRTESSYSRSNSATRPVSTTRAQSTERTQRSGLDEHRSRHTTTPPQHSSRFLPHALTPASSNTSIRSQGPSAPASPGVGPLRHSLPLSHPRPSTAAPMPPSVSPPSRSGHEADKTLEPTVTPGHDDMFEMNDLHGSEGMLSPPISSSDLPQGHHEEHAERKPADNAKGDDMHLSWLDAGGHEKLLRSGFFLLMEDLTGRLHSPCVLDLKMGTRQYSLDATDAKRASQSSKAAATTTRTHGARICGMQVFNCESLSYTFQDKYYGRKVRPSEFQPALGGFLYNGSTLLIHHVPGIVAQLRQLARIVNQLPRYRFYASSLLFIYDGDCAVQSRLMSHFERRVREGRAGVPPAWAVAGIPAAHHRSGKEHHHHAKPHRGEMKIRIIDFAHSTTGKDYRMPGEEFVSPLANQSEEEERHAWSAQADMYTDKEELYEAQDAIEEEAWAEWLSRPIVRFAPVHPEGPDSGYLWGLQNLTATFEAIWETERQTRIQAARQQALAQLDPSLRRPSRRHSRSSISRSLDALSPQAKAIVDMAGRKADLGPLLAPDAGVFDEIFSKIRAAADGDEGYISDKENLDRMAKSGAASASASSKSPPTNQSSSDIHEKNANDHHART